MSRLDQRPQLALFTQQAAIEKVRAAEDSWNTCDAERVALAYTVDSLWRNRNEFMQGRVAIVGWLTRKWTMERDYRLIKELWAYTGDRIAVRFAYECCDADGKWSRSYGNECWEFNANGLMRARYASINNLPITNSDRLFHWDRSGARPMDHPGLAELGL